MDCVSNPGYLGSCNWEDQSLRPTQANSFRDCISKITREKRTGGVAQVVKHLLYKHKVLHSSSNHPAPLTDGERERDRDRDRERQGERE
jgi:hypothetical protein